MPTMDPPRRNKDGSLTFRVRWRERPDYRPTYTFNTNVYGARAEHFCQTLHDLVAAAGETMPTREQLTAFQMEWILPPLESTDKEIPPPAAIVTVAEATRRYLDAKKASVKRLAAKTITDYEGYLRVHIEPRALGAMDVAAVTYEDIENWQRELLTVVSPLGRKILDENSVIKIRTSLVSSVFIWATSVRSGRPPLRAAASPVPDAEMPTGNEPPDRDLLHTPADYALVTGLAYDIDPGWAAKLVTVAATGMRWGEGVQLGPDSVLARRRMLRLAERFSAGEVLAGRKNGMRGIIPVPDWLMDKVLEPRARLDRPVLFVGPGGNRWSYSTEWDRWDALRKALQREGEAIHLTPHCLRHSYRTWLSSHGIAKEKIDMVMGHSRKARKDMSARYTDFTDLDATMIRDAVTTLIPPSAWPGR